MIALFSQEQPELIKYAFDPTKTSEGQEFWSEASTRERTKKSLLGRALLNKMVKRWWQTEPLDAFLSDVAKRLSEK